MNSSRRNALAGAALVFGAMALFVGTHMELRSGLVHFLSQEGDRELAVLSRHLADSALTRDMVLVISSDDVGTSLAAAAAWEEVLARHPEVERIRGGPDPGLVDDLRALYFPRRFAFLSDDPRRDLPRRLDDAGLQRSARRLRETLSLPEGAMLKDLAASDPLLAFGDLLERFRSARMGSLDVVSGRFAVADRAKAVLFLTTRHSPFASSHQAPLEDLLLESFAGLDARHGGVLELERAGVHRLSVASERSARGDAQRISVFSLLGILLVFALLFRSLALLGVTLVPIGAAVLTASAGSLIVFGELHLMTLAFGATLLGVCLDFPIHYACHHTLLPEESAGPTAISRVWGAIAMGGATTIAGFLGLASAEFPGVREIGVFSALGIAGALATTRLVLPALMPPGGQAPAIERRAARGLEALLAWLRGRRRLLLVPLAAAGLICLAGLPGLEWQDDVFELSIPLDAESLAEDERVRDLVSQMEPGLFAVAIGHDDEQALQVNDAIHARLVRAREEGLLEDFRSLHVFLPAASLQRENRAVLDRIPRLASRTAAALEAEGFRGEAFEPFARALEEAPPPPLRMEDLADSALADLVRPFRVELAGEDGERVALLTFLKGVREPAALGEALSGVDGARFFDQRSFVLALYREYRQRTSTAIGIGLVAVAVLLALRYRNPRVALSAALPAMIAAATTVGLLSLLGIEINLVHLLGLLLVLSIGVDYSIFLVASRSRAEETAPTLLSICIACVSTCLSFGLLSLSSFPALRDLGVVTGVGVLFSLLFAPLVLVWLDSGGSRE